jgi:hypothetical protein
MINQIPPKRIMTSETYLKVRLFEIVTSGNFDLIFMNNKVIYYTFPFELFTKLVFFIET